MNNLSKEKKQQIAFVAMITAIVVAGIWFGLIGSQKKNLADAEQRTAAARAKVENAQKLIKQAELVHEQLAETQADLNEREETMASGDLYQWVLSRMITVTSARPVTNFKADPPTLVDAMLLPNFSYRAAIYPIKMTGHFHDLGKVIADVENQFPYARIQNIEMTPAPLQGNERLNLSFEFVSLYQTNRAISIK